MADEDENTENLGEPGKAEDLAKNLLEQVESIGDKIKKKKVHLEEVAEKYHNEARHLQGISSKLRELKGSFNEGEKIKAEFEEFCELINIRCQDMIDKLKKLDAILNEVRAEEEKVPRFTEQARDIDTASLSTGEGRKEFLELKQEVDDWFDAVRFKFKEGKKRKLSLFSKGNVEDVTQSLNAWRKASEVAREYSRKLALLKRDTETNEQDMRREIERMENEITALKEHNKTLDDEISLLRGKMLETEQTILETQTVHDEITDDLREKMKDLYQQLSAEEDRNKQSADEIDRKEAEVVDIREHNKSLDDEIAHLKEKISEAEQTILQNQTLHDEIAEDLREKMKDLRQQLSAEEDRNKQSADEIDRKEAEIVDIRKHNKSLDDEIAQLKERISEAEQTIHQNQTFHDEIAEDLREKIKDLRQQLNEVNRVKFEMELESDRIKGQLQDLESREELNQRKIEMLQERNQLLEDDVESLRERLLEGEKGKDDAEALLFEIQKELQVLDEAKDEQDAPGEDNDFRRVNNLVQTLKKKLEENEGYIENLESEIKGEKDRNSENTDEIEKLLRRIEVEEKGKEEQGQLIDTIRNLLDENEKLAADLESQNKALNEDIAEERERVMELRGRVGELQQAISDEKSANFNMEMEVSKLKNRIEDEESKNELGLKRIELLQKEITTLLDTIKEKVEMIEELRSQLSEYEEIKVKLRAERQRNEDNEQSIMELQNRMVQNEHSLEEKETEIRNIREELKNTKEKLENMEKELEWIKENNDLLSGILQEKDRGLQEKEERLKQALVNLNSERSVQNEYSIKCEMLEKKIYLTETENREITRVAELAESELQKEREKSAHKDNEILKLQAEIEEERKKNMDSERVIQELEEQLSDADALNQYNQGIKSSSIENIMEAEKQNEQLLNIIEELKENVNEKELGIEELVESYAVEEQRLRDEISQLQGQLGLSKLDSQTKHEIIKYLKGEIARMRNVMRIKGSVLGIEGEESEFDENVAKHIRQLEQGLEAVGGEGYDDRSEGREHYDPDEELEEREAQVQELLEILDGEKEKNIMYEEMIQQLEEMMKLKDEIKSVEESDEGKTEEANEARRELYAKKEQYKEKKRKFIQDETGRLEEIVEDLRGRLRAEQRHVKDRDKLISKLNEASNRDLARNEELTAQLHAMKEKAMQQLQHSEEMAKKVEDGQKLIRDLEIQVDKEKLRASTIEAVLSSEKGQSVEKKEVTKDLKRRVEEYQKTVNDIKGKVDKINRHLHCMSPGSHETHRMGSPDVSVKRINERLASHSSFIRELKASVSTVEETSKNIRAELKTQADKNGKQDKKIADLLGKSTEYDKLVEEMKQELGEIRKRYQELSGELGPEEGDDTADGRPESPTKLVRSMPEQELSKQLSNFEELLETIFSEEARRIEELQDKLDEVVKKNMEFSSILYEIRNNLEDDRVKRGPWEIERDDLKATVAKSEVKIDHLVNSLQQEEMTKGRLEDKIKLLEEELKEKEKIIAALQADIREAEGAIHRLETELTEEKERNFDLQERVIREMEDNLRESKTKLDEIRVQADEEVRKTVDTSAAEKSQKETRIKELENEMLKQSELLNELRSYLEKEQNHVFELTERLEIERNHAAMKDNMIENITVKLKREADRSEELRKLVEEAEDRTLRLSEALTKEQVRGVEQEEEMKQLRDRINEEKHKTSETKEVLEEEMQLSKQLKEKLSFEQLLKSEFERELDKTKSKLSEEQKAKENLQELLCRDKNLMYETENKLREQFDDAKQKEELMEELKSDLDTERKCYKILSERLHSEQSRIVELEIKLKETESIINSDKEMLDSLRDNCLKGEEKQFEVLEKLERAEKLVKEKDDEINSLINELATEKVRVEELLANLESERFSKAQMEERIKELEESTARDELLFQELRSTIDAEVAKHREIAEDHDQEKLTSQVFQEKVRDLEAQVAQDSEIFEELKRTIEIEREQSRKLDELLHEERNEIVRRDSVLTELEGQLYIERIAKDEIEGQLESEKKSNLDLHDQLRSSREEEYNRREVERKLAEEMKYEVEEKLAIQAKKAEELESMLEAEKLNVLDKENTRQDLQRSVEQRDLWLAQMADELTKDLEDSQSSTDEEREARDHNENDNMARRVWTQDNDDLPVVKSPYDDLFSKILAGRNAKKNVRLKAKERKRRLAEKEKLLEDTNRKCEDERKLKEERLAELQATEDRMRVFESEKDTYRNDLARLQDVLDSERNRSHSFEVLLAEQQRVNQDQKELVESLENKVSDGFKRLHAATEHYEEQMRENRARQEENSKLRELCEVQEDKIDELDKELKKINTLYQEKDNFARETFDQLKELRKQLDEAERDVLYKERKVEKTLGDDTTDAVSHRGERLSADRDSKEIVGGLRDEIDNVKKIINYKLTELNNLRQQLSERGESQSQQVPLKKMRDRAEKAEAQLKKLQSSYQLLLTDVEMKTFLVEEAYNEANNLRSALNEKGKIIKELTEKAKLPQQTKVFRDEGEIQKLRTALSQKEKLIQDLDNEYKSKLSKKDAEHKKLQVSVQIMKSIYQGLKAEKEREDAAKNAEKVQKSKEDISTVTAMIHDLKKQIDSLQDEVTGHQQMAQTLKEGDKRAKLPNENEKSYLKRRSSLRGVLSLQIDEKEKKIKRLKMLLNSIENRYGKEILELKESASGLSEKSSTDESEEIITRSQDIGLEQTLPLPDIVGTTNQSAFSGNNENKYEATFVGDDVQMCYETNVIPQRNLEDKRSHSLFSKKKVFFGLLIVAIIVAGLTFGSARKVPGTLLASVIIPFVLLMLAYWFMKKTSFGTSGHDASLKKKLADMEKQEKVLLDKVEEMKIRQEGDANLIEELKKQLEEELADKEAKRVEVEEIMANKEAISNKQRELEAEDFEARMKLEIEKTKLSEAEKMKRGFEEYKMLKEEIDHMKQQREKDMDERQAKIAELEKAAIVSEEKREYGIKAINIPISALPICIAMSVLLCQFFGYHVLAPYIVVCILLTFAFNAWCTKKKVSQMLRDERQNFEEQNEEMGEMTELLDRQFEVVKSQKSAIDILVKEIEKEKQERKEKRDTLAKLIWQLQEMEGMQNIISKQAPKVKEASELEAAVRNKAEERALARAKFYNSMIRTLKEINADEEEDDEMTDDLCGAVQELADYAEDQLEEQKKKELEEEKPKPPRKKPQVPWKAISFGAVNIGALAASLALQSYLVAALVALQALIYGLQRREGSVDQLKEKLRREAIRNRSLQLETEKMKKLLETERTYKMSDEYALEIKERRKTRISMKIRG